MNAIKWVIGIMILLGSGGLTFALNQSKNADQKAVNAVEIAIQAKDKSAAIDVLSERVSSVQKEVGRLSRMDEKLGEMQVVQSKTDGKIAIILEKIENLERAD